MIVDQFPPIAPKRYRCRKCGLTALAPTVRKCVNPRDKFDGLCANRQECHRRQMRYRNRARSR